MGEWQDPFEYENVYTPGSSSLLLIPAIGLIGVVLALLVWLAAPAHATHCQLRPSPIYSPPLKAQPFVGGDYPDWNGFPIFHAPTTTTASCQ